MKNNFFLSFLVFFTLLSFNLNSKELKINSSNVQYDNEKKITIFKGEVSSEDEKGNKLFSPYAEYNKTLELFETRGETKIITSGGYEIIGSNVFLDNRKNTIYSDNDTQIFDKDGNQISVEMFNYSILTNIFFSQGNIQILDINNNIYNFAEIYIDEKKKRVIGSDIKAFLKQSDFSLNTKNEPRFFANTMSLTENTNTFEKGIFTYCKNRGKNKCPPWALQSKRIRHDLAKKTIYYDNVVLKVYDFPIFFAPKFSHPDPTVKRRSGLLAPSFSSSTTLGSGIATRYFWNISNDKDLTLTPKLYAKENPLMLAEYRQAFENSFLIVDAGYTQGYKKTNNKKSDGGRAHFFSNFNMNLINENEKNSNIEINLEKVSNDTYMKIYDVETALVNKNKNVLENTIDFSYQNKDFYLGFTPSIYEDIGKSAHLRHEYLLPLTVEKNIMSSQKYGLVDLNSNVKIKNYETNKQTNFFVNNFNWKSIKWLNKFGIENHFEGLIKTVNYEAKKTDEFKNDSTNTEISSAMGYFAKMGLYKKDVINNNFFTFTPKFLLRYAPGHMRDIEDGKLNYGNLFNLNKVDKFDVIENGLSTSIGFEYKKNKIDKNNNIGNEIISFSAGQVVSAKENMDIPSSTSLDQHFSDIVGESKFNINEKLNLNYDFAIDQGYKNFNYNEVSADIGFQKAKFNVGYLQERNHVGNKEYITSGVDFQLNNSSELSFATKRNILTSSAEFYNLNYNYINDCLKAGLAYRREFYTDKDLEATNSLMFTITIVPFAEINTPNFK